MKQRQTGRRIGRAGAALLLGAVCISGLFSAVSAQLPQEIVGVAALGGLGGFTPSSANPRLIQRISSSFDGDLASDARLFRFTPAGSAERGVRGVTVAVRVDSHAARLLSSRRQVAFGKSTASRTGMPAIAPVAFNLGVARGYHSFSQDLAALTGGGKSTPGRSLQGRLAAREDMSSAASRSLVLPSDVRLIEMPDLASFTPARPADRSRFSAQVVLDGRELPGTAPRTLAGDGGVSVDVGGAYRVARNLDVTAGLRYSAERDRVAPGAGDQQDSQAVYVGTKFKF
ncbi:hypothetical protein RM533_06050 [Croceicoccus sp. F390]|uniref:Porin domain-containing protein n=1 Tax=Croceicoccus esteveae TaxID=3075597 RepID=A0ABU2ZGM6_9SPHN|nr:hypothetical protein [Croceicoccus sp. F390]MDT0575743.1 hypothetical protein [Croceicoccus sp. F390]